MSWTQALVRGLAVFLYFVVATVWLPDAVLELGAVADAPAGVRDAVGLVVWGGAFVAGIWMLRLGQTRGLI